MIASWIDGLMDNWSDGVLEHWSFALAQLQQSTDPSLQ
jgi:hypothetical protein